MKPPLFLLLPSLAGLLPLGGGGGGGALVVQDGTELNAYPKSLGILIIRNCGYFTDEKRMNPDQVSREERPRGEAESHYTGSQLVLHFPRPIMQLVFNQPVSTICVPSYPRGFRGYPAGLRK